MSTNSTTFQQAAEHALAATPRDSDVKFTLGFLGGYLSKCDAITFSDPKTGQQVEFKRVAP